MSFIVSALSPAELPFCRPQQGSMALYILFVLSFASSALNPAVVHLMS
jgi:hypothetical protein